MQDIQALLLRSIRDMCHDAADRPILPLYASFEQRFTAAMAEAPDISDFISGVMGQAAPRGEGD
ncbi:MAG: hypothetical protein ACLFRU_11505 [Paracoccaceae bacterium]